ncbi:hypothetical protein ABZ791_10610 [Streptomyces huasconensis]|uniref:Uncharacterized protein n=1 Tax=Streptomyces huasconensis TaxID=1854574 RepID=A0ABV3M708_9ACTN
MTTAVQVEITDELAISTLRSVVAERPGYIYSAPDHMEVGSTDTSCFYVHTDEGGSPVSAGCVIGVVLNRLGLPLERLAMEEGITASSVVMRNFPRLSAKTREQFNDMQMRQDEGEPWGLAYAKATGDTI